MSVKHITLAVITASLTAASAQAQGQLNSKKSICCLRRVSAVALDTTLVPASVEIAGDTAYVSFFQDGLQTRVDVSDPQFLVPSTNTFHNPPGGDQWDEAHYVEGYDRLFTGHRFGGLNMLDAGGASGPFSPLDTASTLYHFSGLASWTDPNTSTPYLFYGEHPAGGGPGGLRIFDVTSGLDTPCGGSSGEALVDLRDGGDLVVTSDGNWVFQYLPSGDYAGNQQSSLIAYDVSLKCFPFAHPLVPIGANEGSKNVDIVLSTDDKHLFVGADQDGLQVFDVQNQPTPALCNSLSIPGYDTIRGINRYNDELLVVWAKNSSPVRMSVSLVNVSVPCNPRVICTQAISTSTKEVDVHEGVVYLVRRITATTGTVLEVWL